MPAAGLKTWLSEDVKRQNYVTSMLTKLYESWSYEPIEIPTLIDMKVLERANIKFQAKTFKVTDKDGEILALRPELTQPIAKAISSRKDELSFPQRLYYSSTVFRHSGKTTDDSRELLQTGVEHIGSRASLDNLSDQEIIYLFMQSAQQFKLKNWIVTITHADIWNKIFEDYKENNLAKNAYDLLLKGDLISFEKLIDKAHPLRALIEVNDISEIERIFKLDLSQLKQVLKDLSKNFSNIVFDPSQCPDTQLYTGVHFNLLADAQGDILAMGGRYDNLYQHFSHERDTESIPAVGFAYYIPRFLNALQEQNLIPEELSKEVEIASKSSNWCETLEKAQSCIKANKRIKLET